MDLCNATIEEMITGQLTGKFSAQDISKHHLDRITQSDSGAFLRLCPTNELSDGPLHGIPVAISDEICIKGVETTAGSKILAGYIPPYQATVVEKLAKAGALIIGKVNVGEFAMDVADAPSSSGAVAVASGQVVSAIAADVGGGVRIPAAWHGMVGFVPTYGRISRYGVIEHAPSLNQIGIICRTLDDVTQIYEAIAGYDPLDSTSLEDKPSLQGVLAQLKVGVSPGMSAIKGLLEALGCGLVDVEMAYLDHASKILSLIAAAEASSTLGTYDGVRFGYRAAGCQDVRELFSRTRAEGFGDGAKFTMLLGAHILSGDNYHNYYMQALKARTAIISEMNRIWQECDILVLPTLADDLRKYTAISSLAGLPAITMPWGKHGAVQLVAPQGQEGRLFSLGKRLEAVGQGGEAHA